MPSTFARIAHRGPQRRLSPSWLCAKTLSGTRRAGMQGAARARPRALTPTSPPIQNSICELSRCGGRARMDRGPRPQVMNGARIESSHSRARTHAHTWTHRLRWRSIVWWGVLGALSRDGAARGAGLGACGSAPRSGYHWGHAARQKMPANPQNMRVSKKFSNCPHTDSFETQSSIRRGAELCGRAAGGLARSCGRVLSGRAALR